MKDLKDFFGKGVVKKPKVENDEESNSEPERKRRRKSAKKQEEIIENQSDMKKSKKLDTELNGNSGDGLTKKKKRENKRKLSEDNQLSPQVEVCIDLADDRDQNVKNSVQQDEVVTSNKKKRKVSAERMSPLDEEMEYSPPAVNNSLLNYFNKIDKSESVLTPKLGRSVLTVKAVVHNPPSTDPTEKKKRSPVVEEMKMKIRMSLSANREKKKKKSEKQVDYDAIVCESVEETVVESRVGETVSVDLTSSGEERLHDVIVVDENSNSTPASKKAPKVTIKMKHDGTLGSFFTIGNRVPKPMFCLTEEQKQAKHNFLQSGSPANIKKIVASSVSQSSGLPTPLPTVSHVRQKDPMHIIWNLTSVNLKMKKVDNDVTLPPWSTITQAHKVLPINGVDKISQNQGTFDQKKELKLLKKEVAEGLPVAVWFKDLREMKKSNEGLIWSEKYKPKSIVHLSLCTIQNVEKLQNWLVTMRDNTKKEESEAYDSEDDFIVDDNSSDCRIARFKKAALITGPNGIGKTAVVYAVATELGYQILELNASANRSGKRILQEFSEALQSHKVEANPVANLIGKKGSKKKKDVPKLPKHSLILVEDADLLFTDNDDGFLSTVSTLAASSKRPVVFIANERGCKHLLSKISSHLEIDLYFSSLRHERISAWLRTISIAESMPLNSNEADQLVLWAKNLDIRKCLLQMEFLRAGNFTITNNSFPFDSRSCSRIWNKLGEAELSSRNNSLRHCLDLLTVADILLTTIKTQLKNDNPCQRYWESAGRDSTELVTPPGESMNLLAEEISAYSLSVIDNVIEGPHTCHYEMSKREELFSEMEQTLIPPVSLLSRSAVALDMSPALRNIARSENARFVGQTKRNNRYFHYLRPDDVRASLKMDFDFFSKPFSSANCTEPSIDFDKADT